MNMPTPKVMMQSGRVKTEGDELYYEVRGKGQPLLLIPGGGGDGDLYLGIADILADDFKVILYDRRANARSTINNPQNFEISQQSRDAVAVLQACGEESAFVFGNSSGANIALDLAKTHPQAVRCVVAHEPPLPRIHPQAKKWQRFFASVYQTGFGFGGSSLAAVRFFFGIEVPALEMIKAQTNLIKQNKERQEQSDQPRIASKDTTDFLIQQELLPVTNYLPDITGTQQNGTRVIIAIGKWSLEHKNWLAEVAQVLANKLGCELAIFPGHHGSFMDMPVEFAEKLRTILQKAE